MSKIFIVIILFLFTNFLCFSQKVEINHLSRNINTQEAEFNFIQTDNNTAYYSSSTLEQGKYQTLIFKSVKKNGFWSKGRYEPLGKSYSYSNINVPINDSNIYFSVINKTGNSKIALKRHDSPSYEILNDNINLENYTNTQPHKTTFNNIDVLYFVSDRKGGFGGLDIWFCIIDKFGNFGQAINAGEKINSKHNEITPFYNVWTGELYFSSDRNNKQSGIDIYKSSGSLNLWKYSEKVEELCSEKDELYLSFYNELSGSFSSNRSTSMSSCEEICCNDIFSFEYPYFKDTSTKFIDSFNKYLPLTLYFHNDEPNPRSLKTFTDIDYKECYISYYLLKKNYLEINNRIEIEQFFEQTLKENYNKLNYTLNNLLRSLENGNKIEIHIRGFASPLHEKDYNINLSLRRIASVINMINDYENGSLKKHLKNGRLKIIKLPFGENKSDKNVSDNPTDRKNSVYSKEAMLERKIEIVKILEIN